jgi:hypothetical protein
VGSIAVRLAVITEPSRPTFFRFMEDVDREISEMKLSLNARARIVAESYLTAVSPGHPSHDCGCGTHPPLLKSSIRSGILRSYLSEVYFMKTRQRYDLDKRHHVSEIAR